MPADGVVIAKEAFRLVEQSQAYQGEEVASYLFHAYGTNLQFAPGEFNFVKTRAEHGTKEAFRLRDEHFHVPEPEDGRSPTDSDTVSATFVKSSSAETRGREHAHTRHRRCHPDSDRPIVQGDTGQHAARDADHHRAARGGSPRRYRPVRDRRHHLRRIALRRRRSGPVCRRGDRNGGRSRPVGQPALRGQSDRDRQRGRADRLGYGARRCRRRRAVTVDDAADEMADPRSRAEVRGAVDAADPRRDAGCAGEGHVDHRRLEHRAGGRDHPRGDGRLGRAVTSARHRRDRRRQVRRRDRPAEGAAGRRLGRRLQRRRAPAPRHHGREARRA